jgi:phosphomannomutase
MTMHEKQTPAHIFRAYDIRGIFGEDFTAEIAKDVGKAFGTHLGLGKKVCIGKDPRNSGDIIENAFVSGLVNVGCNAVLVDMLPIPVLSFLTWKKGYDAGVYISASHNPPEYNGIRFRSKYGHGYLYSDTNIMAILGEKKFRKIRPYEIGYIKKYSREVAMNEYLEYIRKKLDIKRKIRIVLDPGNGSACVAQGLYRGVGCEIRGINTKVDGNFPGRGAEPTEKALEGASKLVVIDNADFGVGFDADADRGIVIDNFGRVVPAEKVAIIIAREMIKAQKEKGKIVAGFDCSMLIEKECAKLGIEVIRSRVGDIFVANAVKEHQAMMGVEHTGHFFLPMFQYSDDPFTMSLKLAEILSKTNKRLSEIADRIPDYPHYSKSFECADDTKFSVMEEIKIELGKEGYSMDLTDGIRILTDNWVVLIRVSNTQPLIRLYVQTAAGNLSELTERFEPKLVELINRSGK